MKPVYTKIPDEPDPDAPVYNVVAGATSTLENFNGNMALGQKLLEKADWGTEYSGKFPVTVTLENTASGASGLIFVKYDKTKMCIRDSCYGFPELCPVSAHDGV